MSMTPLLQRWSAVTRRCGVREGELCDADRVKLVVIRRRGGRPSQLPSTSEVMLSSCRALTDRACVSLAHAVPNLEVWRWPISVAALKDADWSSCSPRHAAEEARFGAGDTYHRCGAFGADAAETHCRGVWIDGAGQGDVDGRHQAEGVAASGWARRSAASRRRQPHHSASTADDDSLPTYDEDASGELLSRRQARI